MTDSKRVLIAEDEVLTALELRDTLEHLGYTVVDAVPTGEQAIEKALVTEPDLLLMDIRLAGSITGIEASQTIREQIDVPVIFLTAFGDEETIEKAKKTGPFGYVLKPVQDRELRASIEVALGKYESTHGLQKKHDDLQQLLDGLRIGTVMTDEEGQITFISRIARRLLGRLDERALDKHWKQVFPFSEKLCNTLENHSEDTDTPQRTISARVRSGGGRDYRMEIDVTRDPRDARRQIFVFYDVTEVHDLRRQINQNATYFDLIGESEVMQQVFQQINAVAEVDATVLIEGDTGTGKELVARAIHAASHRSKRPFVAVNCAALTESLAASQLFGHKKGAFTGAVSDSQGYFGAADGGTLFLDEIGDIPMDIQVNLLRVLEDRQVVRVGETKPRTIDVRIVAASHRSLPEEVQAGRFREDLLYRIRVARIELPALRMRRSDIPLLTQAFLNKITARMDRQIQAISDQAMRLMIDYDWPGNVRELRNAVEYAVIRCTSETIQLEDLPPELSRKNGQPASGVIENLDTEKEKIEAALAHTGGNRTEAARVLGISRATFYRRMDDYGLV